jgi:nucleoid DNA-binding protein
MNKTEFVKLLAKKMETSVVDADKNLKLVFETIGEAISKEDSLAFVGFGTFKTSIRKATKVKTPKGVMVDVPEKRVVKFSAGSDLKEKAASKK